MTIRVCACGCGRTTSVASMTSAREGVAKGQARRFIKGHYQRTVPRRQGYKSVLADRGSVDQHVVIAEAALGRRLPCGVEVHHVDGDIASPHPRLVICQDRAYHRLLHARARVVRGGGDPNVQNICRVCMTPKAFGQFNRHKRNGAMGTLTICKNCQRARDAARYQRNKAGKEMNSAR